MGIRPESRAQSAEPDLVAAVDRATAVFMTGGNQVELATLVVGTPLGEAILRRAPARCAGRRNLGRGEHLSAHMVSFGSGGATPKFRIGQVSQGLGLLDDVIVDQHFTQRNRFGRLLALDRVQPRAARHRHRRGHRGDHPAEWADRGQGPRRGDSGRRRNVLTTSYTATGTQPLMMSGVQLHTLPRGSSSIWSPGGWCPRPDCPIPAVAPTVSVPGGRAGGRPAAEPPDRRRGAHETTSELRRRPASS